MKIRVSVAYARNGEREAGEFIARPRSDHLAANLGRERKDSQRHQFVVGESPYLLLQRDTRAPLLQFSAVAYFEHIAHGFSWRLDSCHSDSISWREASAGLLPCSRSRSSMVLEATPEFAIGLAQR